MYIVTKFHNFTLSIYLTVSIWKWGRWKFVWVYLPDCFTCSQTVKVIVFYALFDIVHNELADNHH